MSFASVKNYPVSVASADLPSAWLSSSAPRVAPATKKIVVISSQNGTQSSGGSMSFLLPSGQGAGYLVSGSAYLRFTVSPTQAVALSYAFKQYGSASSVINRATLLCSGAISEQILNYNKLYASLMLHASSPDFATSDDTINQYTLSGAAIAANVDVCVPLLLGTLNSNQNLPLFLLNSVQLNIDLETVASALMQIGANAVSDYAVSNAQLVFEQLSADNQFEQGMKQMLASRLYQMPINTWFNIKTANTGAITQSIGVNSSSIRSVLWNVVPSEIITRSGAFTSGVQTQARVFLDGALLFNGNLDTTAQPQVAFLEMNRSLNNMFDNDRVSVSCNLDSATTATADSITYAKITRATYLDRAYLGGLSAQKTSEDGFGFVGQPVNSIVLEWTGTSGGSLYIYVAKQEVLTIDGQGNASLVR